MNSRNQNSESSQEQPDRSKYYTVKQYAKNGAIVGSGWGAAGGIGLGSFTYGLNVVLTCIINVRLESVRSHLVPCTLVGITLGSSVGALVGGGMGLFASKSNLKTTNPLLKKDDTSCEANNQRKLK